MFESKKILAFVGARAGSKGLKNKNIIDLAGKPLIAWTIEAALESKYIDRTIVSTDGESIAKVARDFGADAPFLRPPEFSTDESLLDEAMRHCVQWLKENENATYDYIVLLQPTSPLRTAEHIDEALEYFFDHQKTEKDMLISVTPASAKVGWVMQEKEDGYIKFCLGGDKPKRRRQELPQYYFSNGFIYIAATEIMERISDNVAHMIPFVTNEEISTDIDSKEDLEKAEEILRKKNEK